MGHQLVGQSEKHLTSGRAPLQRVVRWLLPARRRPLAIPL
jgi:hypothetical protein